MYDIEIPFENKVIVKWDDMTPIFVEEINALIEDDRVWYRTALKPNLENYHGAWGAFIQLKVVILEFRDEATAALFKLSHL